eukprot:TRINITY_DN32609_c0_g1_i12.p1 TRINITY_DN32609_c0_g1~~TRINITY_DN32609_c0_g1_i12.p1  ORF type:complete len:117 (-),score=7.68 TRINITY_DN32609_c0_g1_i12:657-1007(-)
MTSFPLQRNLFSFPVWNGLNQTKSELFGGMNVHPAKGRGLTPLTPISIPISNSPPARKTGVTLFSTPISLSLFPSTARYSLSSSKCMHFTNILEMELLVTDGLHIGGHIHPVLNVV